jgi:molybdate transport system substrate-binding protein
MAERGGIMRRSRSRPAAVLAVAALVLAACGGGSGGGAGSGSPDEIKVFAAASLTAAFTELGQQYTSANGGTKVTFNFAGSQALATQIQQSAPADVFASADIPSMDKVKDLVGTPQNFAGNLLAIVVEQGNPKHVTGLKDLANPDLKVVLAAPDVPAGKYAAQILGKAGVTVKPVSEEDNVKAVVTKVSLGEADAGIVYVTDVTAGGDKVEGVDIPKDQNVTATYPIATVKASRAQGKAQAFLDLVLSDRGQQVLGRYGFLPPPTT